MPPPCRDQRLWGACELALRWWGPAPRGTWPGQSPHEPLPTNPPAADQREPQTPRQSPWPTQPVPGSQGQSPVPECAGVAAFPPVDCLPVSGQRRKSCKNVHTALFLELNQQFLGIFLKLVFTLDYNKRRTYNLATVLPRNSF